MRADLSGVILETVSSIQKIQNSTFAHKKVKRESLIWLSLFI